MHLGPLKKCKGNPAKDGGAEERTVVFVGA
jgi:hypothetical protein